MLRRTNGRRQVPVIVEGDVALDRIRRRILRDLTGPVRPRRGARERQETTGRRRRSPPAPSATVTAAVGAATRAEATAGATRAAAGEPV